MSTKHTVNWAAQSCLQGRDKKAGKKDFCKLDSVKGNNSLAHTNHVFVADVMQSSNQFYLISTAGIDVNSVDCEKQNRTFVYINTNLNNDWEGAWFYPCAVFQTHRIKTSWLRVRVRVRIHTSAYILSCEVTEINTGKYRVFLFCSCLLTLRKWLAFLEGSMIHHLVIFYLEARNTNLIATNLLATYTGNLQHRKQSRCQNNVVTHGSFGGESSNIVYEQQKRRCTRVAFINSHVRQPEMV